MVETHFALFEVIQFNPALLLNTALFNTDHFMPHGHCYLWTPSLLWLYVISDSLIGLSYFSIPLALMYFVRKRRDLQFHWMFVLFSLFIFACGTTHLISVWTIWVPEYWIDAIVRGITAAVSLVTAILLWPLIPQALRLPSPEHLQTAIAQMQQEVTERRQVESELASLNATLEQRVAERTAELAESNRRLAAEIESRKLAEERFRRAVEHAPNGMVMTTREGVIEMVNEQTEAIFGYQRNELLGNSIEMLVPDRFRSKHPALRDAFYTHPVSRPMGEGRDLYGVRRDGTEVPVEIALNPVATESGTMVLAAIVDISDRKLKEDRIQAQLREKTTLLAEVHHRVKNNLQIIHSLLDLQSMQAEDPKAREVLENSKQRVKSMALIHQALYQSSDFANVNMRDVLRSLVDNIATSYNLSPQRVSIDINVEPINLVITDAIPCALITNELLINALKYAFPEQCSGVITVRLHRENGNYLHLSVADNGIGLPAGTDLENLSSLGLELVSVLADQLDGELTVQWSDPTQFSIRFPYNA